MDLKFRFVSLTSMLVLSIGLVVWIMGTIQQNVLVILIGVIMFFSGMTSQDLEEIKKTLEEMKNEQGNGQRNNRMV